MNRMLMRSFVSQCFLESSINIVNNSVIDILKTVNKGTSMSFTAYLKIR